MFYVLNFKYKFNFKSHEKNFLKNYQTQIKRQIYKSKKKKILRVLIFHMPFAETKTNISTRSPGGCEALHIRNKKLPIQLVCSRSEHATF